LRILFILFILFIAFIAHLSWIQGYRIRLHNTHAPSAATTRQARATYVRLPVEIPDEPEGETGVGVKGIGEASVWVGTGWAAAADTAVLVG